MARTGGQVALRRLLTAFGARVPLVLTLTLAFASAGLISAPAKASDCPDGMHFVPGSTTVCEKRFEAAGTTNWTVPAGVTSIDVLVVGGGGGGSGSSFDLGGGGGGGGGVSVSTEVDVTPGDDYIVTVGAGGGADAGNGQPGGNSELHGPGVTLTAGGGLGGQRKADGNPGQGGNSGSGQPGGAGGGTNTGGGGGGGADGEGHSNSGRVGGAGGNGLNPSSGLFASTFDFYGGGGGGGSHKTGDLPDRPGGNGGNGGGGTGGNGAETERNGQPASGPGGGGGGGGVWRSSPDGTLQGSGGAGAPGIVIIRVGLEVAPPTVDSVSPSSGPIVGGTTVTIAGSNLTGTTQVLFGGVAATEVSVGEDGDALTATTPPGTAGTVAVSVTTPGGIVTKENAFTYFTVPDAPTITGITPGNGQLSVVFTAGGTGGDAITNYEYSTNNGGTWILRDPAATGLPLVIAGLTNGTTYQVRIRAVNNAGAGAASASSDGTPRTTPDPPTGVSGTTGNGQVTVSWTAPESDGGSPITEYVVFSNPGSETCSTAGTSCTVTGLTNGDTYTFTVVATNSAGFSPASMSSSPVTPAAPDPDPTVPSAPTAVTGVAGDEQVSVSWTVPTNTGGSAITGYTVIATPGGATCSTTGATSCTVTGLTNGTAYTFTVTATNGVGTGAASNASSAVTPGDPSPTPEPTPDPAPQEPPPPQPTLERVSLNMGNGHSCDSASVTAFVGTWVDLPASGSCRSVTGLAASRLLGWATTPTFPIEIAQRQVSNGWGAYEIFDVNGRLSAVFIPAGGATLISAGGGLYAIWGN